MTAQLPRACARTTASTSSRWTATAASTAMRDVTRSDIWINGGYFVLQPEIFDQLRPGEDLVEEPFQR